MKRSILKKLAEQIAVVEAHILDKPLSLEEYRRHQGRREALKEAVETVKKTTEADEDDDDD